MVKILLKHKIMEMCIDKFFNAISKNFNTINSTTIQVSTLNHITIKKYIGYDLINLILDSSIERYMSTYDYNVLVKTVEHTCINFPCTIKMGDSSGTVNLYNNGIKIGTLDYMHHNPSGDEIDIDDYLYIVVVNK